jgi:hypothetical protein
MNHKIANTSSAQNPIETTPFSKSQHKIKSSEQKLTFEKGTGLI